MHSGHRSRLKERMLEQGLDGFESHNILELLLFFSIPRRDTNEIAHTLINEFGSLSSVFDAPFEDLLSVKGVGKNTAYLLKLIPEISRAYIEDKYSVGTVLNDPEKVGDFLLSKYIGRNDEVVILLLMDNKCKVLYCSVIFEGSVNAASVSIRKIAEIALRVKATVAIISHNHPNGVAVPSNDDVETTRKLFHALDLIGVELVDHIIVADNDYISMAQSARYRSIFRK